MENNAKDNNPYSRLMALKRMGVVENYEKIREQSIIIVGVVSFSGVCSLFFF